MKEEQHIPTLIALVILILGIGSLIFIVQNRAVLYAGADSGTTPKGITITNVSDSAATVNWLTDTAVEGYLRLTKPGLITATEVAYDVRDRGNGVESRQVHSVTLADLSASQTYSFDIVSGTHAYHDSLYTLTTGPALDNPDTAIKPAYGTLTTAANEPEKEALVYASFDGSQMLSTIVNDGSWILPLGLLRSSDLGRYFVPQSSDVAHIQFVDPTSVSLGSASLEAMTPMSTVRLGEQFNFTKEKSYRGLTIAQAQTNGTVDGTVGTNVTFQITSPKKDAAIPSYKPGFKGTGVVGKDVILTISGNNIKPLTQKVLVDSGTLWSWSVDTPLEAGNYTITAASFTADDIPVVVSQGFTILKSGTQVLGDATPAASLKPSATPTPKVSLSPSPSASSAIPQTGNVGVTEVALLAAALLLVFGLFGFAK